MTQSNITKLRGFQDLIDEDARLVSHVEDKARAIAERHQIKEIRIPLIERVELYKRSSGETSDVVEKQMYTFHDRDEAGSVLALRPEGTPGVVRAYIEAGLDRSDPKQRLYYSGPMFRRERPQKGRFRQFHQFGVEIFGQADAECDAELIIMIDELRRELNLELETQINSLGCAKCRPAFRAALLDYGREHLAELCKDCHQRLERNPLRLLDCKIDVKLAAGAPTSLDYLCEDCRQHFATVQRLLTGSGVDYVINPRLVRGLDYYMRTTFEIVSGAVGSQSAVVAGGRYDGLVESLGGAAVPGTGFAIGVERLALALRNKGAAETRLPSAAVISLGDNALLEANNIAAQLRPHLSVVTLSSDRSLKALVKRADKMKVEYVIIIGDEELKGSDVTIRNLKTSSQIKTPLANVVLKVISFVKPNAPMLPKIDKPLFLSLNKTTFMRPKFELAPESRANKATHMGWPALSSTLPEWSIASGLTQMTGTWVGESQPQQVVSLQKKQA